MDYGRNCNDKIVSNGAVKVHALLQDRSVTYCTRLSFEFPNNLQVNLHIKMLHNCRPIWQLKAILKTNLIHSTNMK